MLSRLGLRGVAAMAETGHCNGGLCVGCVLGADGR
jgi:hypothetical protein